MQYPLRQANERELPAKESIDITCSSRNCLSCSKKNECSSCRANFVLFNKRCYSSQCAVFGECLYCTDYDCVQCHPGFKAAFGFCEKSSFYSNKGNIAIIIAISIAFLVLLAIAACFVNRKCKGRELITAKQLASKQLSGQYIIINPQNNNYIFNSISNASNQSSFVNPIDLTKGNAQGFNELEMLNSKINPISNSTDRKKLRKAFLHLNDISVKDSNSKRLTPLKSCVICDSSDLYSFASCGCGLCFKDYNNIVKKRKKYLCFLHKTYIQEGFLFFKDRQELVSLDEEDDEDNQSGKTKEEDLCYVCKVSPGRFGFNCGCLLLLCAKCFNDNMNMFKIRQCPRCKMAYKEK